MKNKIILSIFVAFTAIVSVGFLTSEYSGEPLVPSAQAATIGNLTISVVSSSVPDFLREGDSAENTVMTVRMSASAATTITSLNFSTLGVDGYGAEIVSASLYDGANKLSTIENSFETGASVSRQKDVLFSALNISVASGATKELTLKVKLAPTIQNRAYCVLWLNQIGVAGGSPLEFTSFDIISVVPIVKSYALGSSLFLPVISYQYNNSDRAIFRDVSGNDSNLSCQGRFNFCPKIVKGQVGDPDKNAFALSFDGIDDHIYTTNTTNFVFQGQTTMTVEVWFKPDSPSTWNYPAGAINKPRLTFASQVGVFRMELFSTPSISFSAFMGGNEARASFAARPIFNAYNHAVAVMENSKVKMYLNGQYLGENPMLWYNQSVASNISLSTSKSALRIGMMENQPTYYFKGVIDELYIYPRALSSKEVSAHYNELTGSRLDTPVNMMFDELLGATVFNSGSIFVDNATCLIGKCPAAGGPGRSGTSVKFDGVDDVLAIPNSGAISPRNQITVLIWFKPESKLSVSPWTETFVYKQESYAFYIYNHKARNLLANIWFNDRAQTKIEISTPPSPPAYIDGAWNQAVLTYDGANVKIYTNGTEKASVPFVGEIRPMYQGLLIGKSGDFFKGSMDKLVIMNKAMTALEISKDYELLQPAVVEIDGTKYSQTAYYRFEEPVNSLTFLDFVGKSGLLRCFADTAAGVKITPYCPAVVPGKIGNGVEFNGADTYLSAGTSPGLIFTRAFSLGAWFKYTLKSTLDIGSRYIINKGPNSSYAVYLSNPKDGIITTRIWTDTGSYTASSAKGVVSPGGWYQVYAVYNGVALKLYINGVEVKSVVASGSLLSTDYGFLIGRDANRTSVFNGIIDEVEVFQKALTGSEILAKYRAI